MLQSKADRMFGDYLILLKENAAVYTSNHTRAWLEAPDIEILDWHAK